MSYLYQSTSINPFSFLSTCIGIFLSEKIKPVLVSYLYKINIEEWYKMPGYNGKKICSSSFYFLVYHELGLAWSDYGENGQMPLSKKQSNILPNFSN